MADIALCMIVRDEEAMLGPCLASARDAVTDMVVVDTGSRDASTRIAKDAGARVFDFPWRDDFSAARNEALRHARAEWVLVLDADERLAPGSAGGLHDAVSGARFDCGMLRLHEAARIDARIEDVVAGRGRQAEVQLVPRLLRRADGLRYVDAVHENVMPWLRRRGMKVAAIAVDIVHLGAAGEVIRAKGKIDRNVRLLRVRIDRNPDDLSAHGYLAHDLIRAGAAAEARAVVERGWSRLDPDARGSVREEIHRLATARAFLMIEDGRFAEARGTLRVAREIEGDNPDYAFMTAFAHESEGMRASGVARSERLAAARDGYRTCLGYRERVFAQSFVFGASSWCGATRLGTVELVLRQPADALSAFEAALALRPDDRAARLGRAEAMIHLGAAARALQSLESQLDDASPDAWTLAAAAVGRMGLSADARLFAGRAQALAGKGFIASHRRETLRDIAASFTGRPPHPLP
jgi:glycosyltransferase involved in cell wall biosynthesis